MPAVTQPPFFIAMGNNNIKIIHNFLKNIVFLNTTPTVSLYTAIRVKASIHFTIKKYLNVISSVYS